MEDVGIFYGHLVHFMSFCYILWTFGIVRGNLVYILRFVILYQEKSGNPGSNPMYVCMYVRPCVMYNASAVTTCLRNSKYVCSLVLFNDKNIFFYFPKKLNFKRRMIFGVFTPPTYLHM
jgi:hypothetical protein